MKNRSRHIDRNIFIELFGVNNAVDRKHYRDKNACILLTNTYMYNSNGNIV